MAGGTFGGGTGTVADPYLVQDAADLNAVRNNLSAHFKQVADIDLNVAPYNTGTGWDSMGVPTSANNYKNFQGSYDGAFYLIKNLYQNLTGEVYGGLFAEVVGSVAVLKNIIMTNVNVTSTTPNFPSAGLVASAGACNIKNCKVTGTVTAGGAAGLLAGACANGPTVIDFCEASGAVTGNTRVGGLIGWYKIGSNSSNLLLVANSSFTGDVTGVSAVGGLIGYIGQSALGGLDIQVLKTCYSKGTVKADSLNSGAVSGFGGLIGHIVIDSTYTTLDTFRVVDCYSQSLVAITNSSGSGYFDRIGGFIGQITATAKQNWRVEKCYASGKVSTNGSACIGGFIGAHEASGPDNQEIFSQCSSYGDVSLGTNGYIGGFVGYAKGLAGKAQDCYSKSDVSGLNATSAGGFVGRIADGNYAISRCYSSGTISSSAAEKGGFAGLGGASIVDCFYDSTVTGLSDTGKGTPKTTTELTQASTYLNYDFVNVWKINSGSSYAYFLWQTNDSAPAPPNFPEPPTGVTNYIMGRYTEYRDDGGWLDSSLTCFSSTGVPVYSVIDSNAVYTDIDSINDWFGFRSIFLGMVHTIQKYKYDNTAMTWSLDGATYDTDTVKLKLYSSYKTESGEVAATPIPAVNVADSSTYPVPPSRFARSDTMGYLPWVMYYPIGAGDPYINVLYMSVMFKLDASKDNQLVFKRMAQDAKFDAIQFKEDNSKVDIFTYSYDIANGLWKNSTRQTPGVPEYADFSASKVNVWKNNPYLFLGASTPTAPIPDPTVPGSTPGGSVPGGTYTPPPSGGDGSTIPAEAIVYQLKIVTPQGIRWIPLVSSAKGAVAFRTPKDGKRYMPVL